MTIRPEILTGPPKNTKVSGGQRVDFRTKYLDALPVHKGYRCWWSRSAPCPCRSNEISKQPDPTCELCNGRGRIWFSPIIGATNDDVDRAGNPIEVSEDGTAIGISVNITGTSLDPQIYERFGEWLFGTAKITAQSANRIGHYDRLVARDALMWASQIIEANGTDTIEVTGRQAVDGLWAPAAQVNLLRSLTNIYRPDDYDITEDGEILWLTTPPARGTVLTYHGAFHPRWIIIEFPFAVRDTMVAHKKLTKSLAEQWTQLPIHALVKLEFLVQS